MSMEIQSNPPAVTEAPAPKEEVAVQKNEPAVSEEPKGFTGASTFEAPKQAKPFALATELNPSFSAAAAGCPTLPPTASGRVTNQEEAKQFADKILNANLEGYDPDGVPYYDTTGIANTLKDIVQNPALTQPEKGATIEETLNKLSYVDASLAAIQLVNSLPESDLDKIGRKGINKLLSAAQDGANIGFSGASEAVNKLEAELARRGPVDKRTIMLPGMTQGITVIGDEISPADMDRTVASITQMLSKDPKAAAACDGLTVVVTPNDERLTDQDDVWGKLTPMSYWDDKGGGQTGKFLAYKLGQANLLPHELTHAVAGNYLEKITRDSDPVMFQKLLDLLPPGTSIDDANGDGAITGAEVISHAWQMRQGSGAYIPGDYAHTSPIEWFAEIAACYWEGSPKPAAELKAKDPSAFALMEALYGPTPQPV